MSVSLRDLRRFTTAEFERLAEACAIAEDALELLDGFIVATSPKGDRHRWAVDQLAEAFILAARGRYHVSSESLSLRLSDNDEVEPDIAITPRTRDFSRTPPLPNELALVVEVSDATLARDLGPNPIAVRLFYGDERPA